MRINDVTVSENFKLYEFECKDGNHEVKLNPVLLALIQCLRTRVQKPIIILSAYRTPEYNKKVGGAPKSQHMLGNAVDIRIYGMTPTEVAKEAEKVGFTGIGIYNDFTHLDVREGKARWSGYDG